MFEEADRVFWVSRRVFVMAVFCFCNSLLVFLCHNTVPTTILPFDRLPHRMQQAYIQYRGTDILYNPVS